MEKTEGKKKEVVISNSKLNSYGFRVLTEGIDTTQYARNPILLWMHNRPVRGTTDEVLPIGRMENLRIDGDNLIGTPIFDEKLASGQWTADEIIKVASAIEKLDKQTNIVTITEVFTAFNQWLVSRMQVDPGLTPEIVKIINTYQNKLIIEKLGSITIPIE